MKILCKIWLKNGNTIVEKLKVPKCQEQQVVDVLSEMQNNIGTDEVIQVGYTSLKNNEIIAMQVKSL